MLWEQPCTYAQEKALILLDGTQATQKPSHHDNAAKGDDEVGGRERRERGRKSGEAALRHREPEADTQQPTSTQLKHSKPFTFIIYLNVLV